MTEEKKISMTVIIPVYNGETTIVKTLESLYEQTIKPEKVIVFNDNSRDGSLEILERNKEKFGYQLVNHSMNCGLAKTYNEGIKLSESELIITMHQDVILMEDALKKLTGPFSDPGVVAASHVVIHPIDIWRRYNFWQKCFFARLAQKTFSGIDGKFDCFRRKALISAGFFNEKCFRSAGEDGDMVFRLKKIGQIKNTKATIVHIHKDSPLFGIGDIIHKQKQYSEAQGVLFRLGRIDGMEKKFRAFFREIMLFLLLIPIIRYFALVLILTYSIWYTSAVFVNEYKNWRIVILPFLNIYLLFVSLFYSLRGFVLKKQSI